MFSRNLLGSSSVWFHFGKRVLGSVGNFAQFEWKSVIISDAFPLDDAYHGEMIGDDTKRTDEDAVKSETLPSRSSSWPNCTNDPSSKFLLPLPGFQTEIVPFAMLLSEPQSQRCATWMNGWKLGTRNTSRNCCHKKTAWMRLTQKKAGEKASKKGGGAHLLTLRWVARLHLQNWESWPIFSPNWAHCHTCPCWWYSDVSYAAPAPRMPCWMLIGMPFSDAKWTGLGINTVSQSRCFPRFHSSVTSTPSSFRGFSSCFLSCHCGSAWEVWWKGWVSGNDMLNHLAITVSNTSANLSCASTSQKKREAPSGCESACHGHVHKENKEWETEIKRHSTNFGYVYVSALFMFYQQKSLLSYAYIPVQIYMLHVYMSRVQSRRDFLEFDPLVFWGISWTLGFRWK